MQVIIDKIFRPVFKRIHWIEISSGFGLYIKDASINILALQKDSTQIVTKVVENNILNGTFMIKKDGNWFKVNTISKEFHFVPLNSN